LFCNPGDGMNAVIQIFYFGLRDGQMAMAHGNFDGAEDAEGYPAELHELFFYQKP